MSLSYLSVCSGIEAASVAWHSLGFQPVAFAEIDAFPSAVLRHHRRRSEHGIGGVDGDTQQAVIGLGGSRKATSTACSIQAHRPSLGAGSEPARCHPIPRGL